MMNTSEMLQTNRGIEQPIHTNNFGKLRFFVADNVLFRGSYNTGFIIYS